MKCYLELSLRSDTCFAGSGGGRIGTVDTDLETDTRTGLPLVRGRTLKGLLLEELAMILHMLEPGPPGFWHATAAHLFGIPGQPQRGILTFHDGHLPADLQAAVLNNRSWRKTEVLAALTTIRQQTKVDANTGAPETHSLRSTRLLRAGLRLRATMYAGQPLSTAGRALFAAGVAAVRRAGLHRNHGWGEVQLRVLDEQEQDVTAAWLRGLMQPVTEPLTAGMATGHEPPAQPTVVSSTAPAPAVASRRVLSYRLTLTTPAVLATTGGDPSTVATRPFISGAAVLGALAQRWLARAPQGHDAAGDPRFQRCFLDGSVRWLNAYPEGGSSNRLLPCPLSLVQRKGQSEIAYDQASPLFIDLAAKEPGTQWQRLEAPFISIMETDQSEYQLRERKLTLIPRLHHTRDDREAGRSKNGAMFSYIALEAGEQFIGHILCEMPDDAATVRELLKETQLALGRSRTATYGGWAQLESLPEQAGQSWQETPERNVENFTEEEQEQNWLVVTLLSDYLGVNTAGLPDPQALEKELGVALGIIQAPVARFLSTRLVAGYVSHWRMPRPSHPAVTAGSVLVYKDATPDSQQLCELCWQGIGQRRAEGFGRVVVHWHGALKIGAGKEPSPAVEPPADLSATPSSELIYLQRNLLANALRRALTYRAVADARAVSRLPSPTLISRLRARVRTATGAAQVKDFLRAGIRLEGKGLKKAGQALSRARLGQQPLDQWLENWILGEEQNQLPQWTQCREVQEECTRLGLALDLLSDETRWQLLQTYLDAFCEQLRRRAAQAQPAGGTVGRG